MSLEQEKAQHFGFVQFEQFVQQHDVAKRFGHLATVHRQHAVVQPIFRERCAAMRADALRNLVFVMREH